MKNKQIEFNLLDSNGELLMTIGHIKWPWAIRSIIKHGDLIEVVDAHQRSVFSLEDIRLHDLFHT